jgi:hypothetical protein
MSTSSDEQIRPLVVSPKVAEILIDSSHDKLYQLLATGELESYLDGRLRKITMRSIEAYIARRLAAAPSFQRSRYPQRIAVEPTDVARSSRRTPRR